jgi:hypothetical protein
MRFETIAMRVGVALGLACAAGCGSFVESSDSTARLTVGPTGGALHLDAFSLTVPPDALVHTVTLAVHRATFDAPDGHAFVLEPADALFAAAAPATVSLAYDATVYPHPVEVFVATFTGTAWHLLPAAGAAEVGVAHASLTQAGTFGLIHCPGGVCPTSNTDASAGH